VQFLLYQVPYLGNGMTIALVGIIHNVISHGLSIGAMTLIVLFEYLGFRKNSADWDKFAKGFLKVAIITITGVGATTGAGIWLTISALSARGVGSLIRIFFWPWFAEWVVFVAEVIVIMAYYFTWEPWRDGKKRQHIYLGLAYVLLAVVSAFLITGIVSFMLTSDGWPWDNNFWSAFLNPGFISQLFLRLAISAVLGSLFAAAFLLFTRQSEGFRREALPCLGKITLLSLLAIVVSTGWYLAVVPSRFKAFVIFSCLTSHCSQHPELLFGIVAVAILVTLAFSFHAWRGSVAPVRLLVIPAFLLSVAFLSEFERAREFIRGPYLLPGYLYTNQVLLKERTLYRSEGMLPNSYWYRILGSQDAFHQGAYLFAQNCSSCHTIDGINDIKERLKGRTEEGIFVILGHTSDLVPFMPPFSGSKEERAITAKFLYQLSTGAIKMPAPSRYTPLSPSRSGEGGNG
jgi:hypothetical protein